MKDLSDMELLEAYAKQHSEDAFRELVSRHVDCAFAAALRQLRNAHLAEEATQSAFIALAEKAGRLPRQTVIAGWLHRAVHFAAHKIWRGESRRKLREEKAETMSESGASGPEFDAILPWIDGALADLSTTDRDAIVLRYLRQKSLQEVALAQGTSEEAAKKRVQRALDKLRVLLVRRGITIPLAALTAGLSNLPLIAAPVELSASVTQAVLQGATYGASSATFFGKLMVSSQARLAAVGGLTLITGLLGLYLHQRPTFLVAAPPTAMTESRIRIKLTSVLVNDQEQALKFYTERLGFVKKNDLPMGGARWLTVVSPDEPDGTELLLEPMGFPPARTFQAALLQSGIPLTAFPVKDIEAQYKRLTNSGVEFAEKPAATGSVKMAVLKDTCGNWIQLFQPPDFGPSKSEFPIKIRLSSILVRDQEKALRFYTEKLGLIKKQDFEVGGGRWLTVVSPAEPDGTELALEPAGFPSVKVYQEALHNAGIPLTALIVTDTQAEYERLAALGVEFTGKPERMGPSMAAVFDDTCGNLIQIFQK